MVESRQIRLKSRPSGTPTVDNFELATVMLREPAPGEVQVKNLWMTVDPYMRNRMGDHASTVATFEPDKPMHGAVTGSASANEHLHKRGDLVSTMYDWRPPFRLGQVLEGGAIGQIAVSNDPGFKQGDLVSNNLGWREGFNAPAAAVQKLNTFGFPPQALLGVAGMPGLTAWAGLLKIATLRSGDVVFVSGASGAVGSAVCQIAKLKGNLVIGSAGGEDKCAFLRQIGVDRVINYKATSNLTSALLEAAPDGIDV